MDNCDINDKVRVSTFIQLEFSNCKTIDEVVQKYTEINKSIENAFLERLNELIKDKE